MPEERKHINIRFEISTYKKLLTYSAQRQIDTGERVTVSDIVREFVVNEFTRIDYEPRSST